MLQDQFSLLAPANQLDRVSRGGVISWHIPSFRLVHNDIIMMLMMTKKNSLAGSIYKDERGDGTLVAH